MSYLERLWAYQAERFPLKKTVPLLALFAVAAIHVSAHAQSEELPKFGAYIAGLVLALILFFQMRVADEHKDYEDDLRYRPERPVQRGLVTLAELRKLAVAAAILAMIVAVTGAFVTAICLSVTWIWFGLMSFEFFVPAWLKARPVLYLLSHMMIMPLIALMLATLSWSWAAPSSGLWLFLALSFANGCALEIGRKIWAPENERDGVETYSALWGTDLGALVWTLFVALAAGLLGLLGRTLGVAYIFMPLAALALIAALVLAQQFRIKPTPQGQDRIDLASGLWVALSYGLCAALPLLGGVT